MWQEDQFDLCFSQVTTRSRSTMTYCTPKDTIRKNPVVFHYLSVSNLDSHLTFPHHGYDASKAGDLKETQSSLKQSQADRGNPGRCFCGGARCVSMCLGKRKVMV